MSRKPVTRLFVSLLLCVVVFASTASAAAGDLDTTFAGTGFARDAGFGNSRDGVNATALQPDGKIVAVGFVDYGITDNGNFVVCGITRYNADGSLDTSFDVDGKVVVDLGVTLHCEDVAVQPDGKVVVVGYVQTDSIFNFAVFRFNVDGTPDASFDGDGRKISALANADFASTVAIQTDGRIVVVGNIGDDFAIVRYNPDGSFDSSFDTDGLVTTDFFGGPDHARAVAIQADGKILAAGNGRTAGNSTNDFAVARYNTDGSLDSSFDGDGKVLTSLQFHDNPEDIVIQPDGKIVVGGNSWGSNNDFGLARFNSDGSLDTSFDGDGKVINNIWVNYDYLSGLAVQADGKIIVIGTGTDGSGASHFGFVRYNANGSLDTSLEGDGSMLIPVVASGGAGTAMELQPDGRIILAGKGGVLNTWLAQDFVLARLNPNGSFDTSFDGDGKVLTNVRSWKSFARAAAIQPDGKIVAVGNGQDIDSEYFAVYRYNANGTLDTSFDGDGRVFTFSGNHNRSNAFAIAFQPDGKIIVVGQSYQEAAIIRYNPNGSLDTSFDTDGIRNESCGNSDCYMTAVAVQSDGKILAGGRSYVAFTPGWDFTIFRYNQNGSRDTSFDGDGKVTTDFSGTYALKDGITAMALQADGKIVAAGVAAETGNSNFAIARYNPDGSLDTSFDGDGKATTDFTGGTDYANGLAIQSDGRIVVAGYSSDDTAVVRYNSDGALDSSFDGDGKVRLTVSANFTDAATGVAIQADGKIVTSGYAKNILTSDLIPSNRDSVLVRFNSNGSVDFGYGNNGKAILDVSPTDQTYGITIDSLGRAVVAGETDSNFTVARYLGGGATFNVNAPFDFDGDGKSDISIFRPSNGQWWWLRSSDSQVLALQFGAAADRIMPADYTGDGKTDVALWRPSTGEWFVLRSEDATYFAFPFGTAGDLPAAADFDNDDYADPAVFRPSSGTWYISKSTGGTEIFSFGQDGDVPTVGDFDADGKADAAIFRPSNGQWWLNRSSAGVFAATFGAGTDKPVVGDYTGDGKADIAFWRPSTGEWFVLRSDDLSYYSVPFGTSGDIPTPGDYDGDGRSDTAVFRTSNQNWFINRTTSGMLIQQFGAAGDTPVPSAFVP